MIRDVDEFKKAFPKLEITPTHEKNGVQLYDVKAGSTSWSAFAMPIDDENVMKFLARENSRLQVKEDFQKKYPFLYPWVDHSEKISGLWVSRNGWDAEAMPPPRDIVTRQYTEEELQFHNQQAMQANQKGWFYCSGCGRAKPESQYAYFHFAGSYCIECKDADMAAYKAAMLENYD